MAHIQLASRMARPKPEPPKDAPKTEDLVKPTPRTREEILSAITKLLHKENFPNPYCSELRLTAKGLTRFAKQYLTGEIGVAVNALTPYGREISTIIHAYRCRRIDERGAELQNQQISKAEITRTIAREFGVPTSTVEMAHVIYNKRIIGGAEATIPTSAIPTQFRRKTRAESDSERRSAAEKFIADLPPAVLLVSIPRIGHYVIKYPGAHVLKPANRVGLKVTELIKSRQLEILQEANSKGKDMQTVAREFNVPPEILACLCKAITFEFKAACRAVTNSELRLDIICAAIAKIQKPFRLKVVSGSKTLVGMSLDLIAHESEVNPAKLRKFMTLEDNANAILSAVDEAKKQALLKAHAAGIRFHGALIRFEVDRRTLLDAIERFFPNKTQVSVNSFTAETMGKLRTGIDTLDPEIKTRLIDAIGMRALPTTRNGVPDIVFQIIRENLLQTSPHGCNDILRAAIYDYESEIVEIIKMIENGQLKESDRRK